MTNETRLRAAALLDVLRHREPGDRTAEHRRRAARFRQLARRTLPRGSRPPELPRVTFEWAWADNLELPTEPEAPLRLVQTWWPRGAAPLSPFLALSSTTGLGKSVAALWALSHRGGEYLRAAAIAEWPLGNPPELGHFVAVDVLILEELGREADIGPMLDRVRELLAARIESGRPTLVTTNLPLAPVKNGESFSSRYGEHLYDRVRGSGQYVALRGESLRDPRRKPILHGIERSCRIADLVAEVERLTGVAPHGAGDPIAELEVLFEVDQAELDAAIERRAGWQHTAASPAEVVESILTRWNGENR